MVGAGRRRVRLRAGIWDRTPVPRTMGTAVDRTLVTCPLLRHAQRGCRGRRDTLDLDGSTCAVDSTVQLGSHIVIDVSKHSADYYPSRVLYPITQRGFDALAWNTPWFLVPNYFVLCAVVGGFGEHAETLAAANVRTAIDPKVSLEGWASLRCSRPIKCARHLPVFRQRSRELGLGPTRPSTVQPRARG